MKEKRFVELVNVYLDGEISAAETAELEREIRSSAERMELYRRYCRMQKACLQIAQQHREAAAPAAGNVVRFPEEKQRWVLGQWWRGAAYAGTAAVAASVILMISMSGPGQPQVTGPSVDTARKIVQIPVGEFARAESAGSRLASLSDRWSTLTRLEASAIPVSFNVRTPPEFAPAPSVVDWTADSVLPASGPIEFRFRTDSVSGARVLHGRPHGRGGDVEFTTFQFAR